jgi:hypothetical protein
MAHPLTVRYRSLAGISAPDGPDRTIAPSDPPAIARLQVHELLALLDGNVIVDYWRGSALRPRMQFAADRPRGALRCIAAALDAQPSALMANRITAPVKSNRGLAHRHAKIGTFPQIIVRLVIPRLAVEQLGDPKPIH